MVCGTLRSLQTWSPPAWLTSVSEHPADNVGVCPSQSATRFANGLAWL